MELNKIAQTEPTIRNIKKNNTKISLTLPLIQNNSLSPRSINKEKIKIKKTFQSVKKSKSKNKKIKIREKISNSYRKEKRIKINKDLDLVNKLNMELEVDELFSEESKLKKQKEKIDNNPDIIAKRLNIYKSNSEKGETKIEVDSKEKEKYIEKEFRDELEEFTKMKKECNIINEKINKLREDIDEYNLDINVFSKYGDELDKKSA